MKRFILALAAGLVSAFAFEPVGWWPLMLLAFAALCELINRAGSLRQALLTGWAFGLGQFVLGLNWIATAFTYQSAMPAWLGWVAVALLSLYLAVYPAVAAGLAWRHGRAHPIAEPEHHGAGPEPVRRLDRQAEVAGRRRRPRDDLGALGGLQHSGDRDEVGMEVAAGDATLD